MKFDNRKSYKPGPRDECGTPQFGVVPIVQALDTFNSIINGPSAARWRLTVWEPMVGPEMEHMGLVQGLQRLGFTVIATYYDFWNRKMPNEHWLGYPEPDVILTNPPYSNSAKRKTIETCEYHRKENGLPWALLTNPLTIGEKRIRRAGLLDGVSMSAPLGRIPFKMPKKGWGTIEEPTSPTFYTAWITKDLLLQPGQIYQDDFEMRQDYWATLPQWEAYVAKHGVDTIFRFDYKYAFLNHINLTAKDWKDRTYEEVRLLTLQMFIENSKLRDQLLETGVKYLRYGQGIHDNLWGDCQCLQCYETPGRNWYGHILQEVRAKIR